MKITAFNFYRSRYFQAIIILIGLQPMCGCERSSDRHEMKVDEIRLVVIQPGAKHNFATESGCGYLKEKDSDTGLEVVVRDKHLFVNGLQYGDLTVGDHVRVEVDQVFVNDVKRKALIGY